MDRILTLLNCNEELKKRLPKYLEAFVKYYGEERRQEIEDKFKNLLCIGYQTPDSLERGITKLEENKTEELLTKVFKNTQSFSAIVPQTNKRVKKDNLRYKDIMPITKLYSLIESHRLGKEGRQNRFYNNAFETFNSKIGMTKEEFDELCQTKQIPERYQSLHQHDKDTIMYMIDNTRVEKNYQRNYRDAEKLLKEIIPDINEENFDSLLDNDKLNELYELKEEYEKAIEEYNVYTSTLKEYYERIDKIKTSKRNIEDRLYKEFLKENIDLFPNNRLSEVEDYINGQRTIFTYDLQYLVGTGFNLGSCIEDFSDKANSILNSKEEKEDWKKDTIRKNRVRYFKAMGIDLGDDYESYVSNEQANKIIPTQERIERFQKSKEKFLNEYNIEFYSSLDNHKQVLEEIANVPFIDPNNPINARMYIEGYSFISPNLIKTEEGYKTYPILAINFSQFDFDAFDHIIVHELNHIIETSIGLVGENEYEAFCGWELNTESLTLNTEINTLEKKQIREYELFSEIINELIARDISKMMHEENIYIFDEENNSRYTGTTSYEHSTFLVSDFFNEFKEAIIKSRSNGNIEAIYDEVGKENFDALNGLFKKYNEHFNGMKVYNLYQTLEEGKENEQTRVYEELNRERDNILEKMREYRNNKNISKESYEGINY